MGTPQFNGGVLIKRQTHPPQIPESSTTGRHGSWTMLPSCMRNIERTSLRRSYTLLLIAVVFCMVYVIALDPQLFEPRRQLQRTRSCTISKVLLLVVLFIGVDTRYG